MGKQPFSAKRQRTLPTHTGTQSVEQTLANWQAQLNPVVKNVAPQATPLNFSVTNSRGGLTLKWSPVRGGDGYEILKSANGSFTDDLQVIPVKNVSQSTFFDSTGGNAQTAHYRIRTTSGTPSNPQSQRGPESGVIQHTSIDASDTNSVPTTQFDSFTTDKTRSAARRGNYGAIHASPLGVAGGSQVGSGTKGGSGTSAGTPAKNATSFASLGTSTNNSATLIVGSGAQLIPDTSNPGKIQATELDGSFGSIVASGQSIIDCGSSSRNLTLEILRGAQADLPSKLPLALGEMYFATDTGNLFFGTPGIGVGYIQLGDTTLVNETLQKILLEMRALRLAMTNLACEGGQAVPADFDPQQLASDAEVNQL